MWVGESRVGRLATVLDEKQRGNASNVCCRGQNVTVSINTEGTRDTSGSCNPCALCGAGPNR